MRGRPNSPYLIDLFYLFCSSLKDGRFIVMTRAKHAIETSLVLGTQLDKTGHRQFLDSYVKRVAPDKIGSYENIDDVLTKILPEIELDYEKGKAGCVKTALRRFANSQYDLDIRLTGTDYGPFEQRTSPYRVDRTLFHLGFPILTASVEMEFPGYSPYSASRKLDIRIFRENFDPIVDLLPDYLWWEAHDRKEEISDALDVVSLAEKRKAIADAGFSVNSFGLYLVTFQTLHIAEQD